MATQEERKMELEKKKQRLAEIRELKKRREDERRSKLLEHRQDKGDENVPLPTNEEVDRILEDVGISPGRAGRGGSLEPPPAEGGGTEPGAKGQRDASPSRQVYGSSQAKILAKSECVQVNIQPKEMVQYEKGSQTDTAGHREFHVGSIDFWEDPEDLGGRRRHGTHSAGLSGHTSDGSQDDMLAAIAAGNADVFVTGGDQSPTAQLAGILPHIPLIQPAQTALKNGQAEPEKQPIVPLSQEEKMKLMTSDEFVSFFDRATRIVERALTEKADIFVDYSRNESLEQVETGEKVSLVRVFSSPSMIGERCVTGLDYSHRHPELFAAGYGNDPGKPFEPDGLVAVWNCDFDKDVPEYIYHSPSRVTSVCFGKFHPNLIFAGTYSGQLCLWDNRQNKKTPVQKSPLSTSAHTQPVFAMKVVGTHNAHNLVSVSTDGKMCSWSLDKLSQPVESLALKMHAQAVLPVTSLSFPLADVNNFVCGGEDGLVYTGQRHGTSAGVERAYEGHAAPVLAVDCHCAPASLDFSTLFLSCSFDYTVKLWSTKDTKPLHSFDASHDYVLDVGWSPIHPALFACCDAAGRLQIWNVNADTEAPLVALSAAAGGVKAGQAFCRVWKCPQGAVVDDHRANGAPINKLMWMQNGQQIALGDYKGNVLLYELHESVFKPAEGEASRLARTLADIRQAQTEAEHLSMML